MDLLVMKVALRISTSLERMAREGVGLFTDLGDLLRPALEQLEGEERGRVSKQKQKAAHKRAALIQQLRRIR